MIGLVKIDFYPPVLIAFLMTPWVIGIPLGVNKSGLKCQEHRHPYGLYRYNEIDGFNGLHRFDAL